jgi:hypothetical protein
MIGAMFDLERECDALAKADRDIAEGQRRIAEQKALIASMIGQGLETSLAEELLRTLEQTLYEWKIHQQLIREAIITHGGCAG